MFTMKHLLLTTIAAVLLVGCGTTQSHKSAILKPAEPVSEVAPPANPTADRALFDAAKAGNIEAVKQYLTAGADLNLKKDLFGSTPLHSAALKGRKEVAELLVSEGADVNTKNINGWTPLHYAAVVDHKEIVELLLASGADVNAKTDAGETPLDNAIKYKRTETADLLRKHGGKMGEELKAEGK